MQMTSGRALGVRRARPHATSDTAVVWHVSKMHERVKPAARLWDVAVGLWMACTGCDMNVSWVVWRVTVPVGEEVPGHAGDAANERAVPGPEGAGGGGGDG